jgi:hypothetical protein
MPCASSVRLMILHFKIGYIRICVDGCFLGQKEASGIGIAKSQGAPFLRLQAYALEGRTEPGGR